MSPPGRPKGEYRSAQRAGFPIRPPGRPKGEYRSAQRAGFPIRPPGRPKGEYRSAQREGTPMSAARGTVGRAKGRRPRRRAIARRPTTGIAQLESRVEAEA
jgi:hypothetical protein